MLNKCICDVLYEFGTAVQTLCFLVACRNILTWRERTCSEINGWCFYKGLKKWVILTSWIYSSTFYVTCIMHCTVIIWQCPIVYSNSNSYKIHLLYISMYTFSRQFYSKWLEQKQLVTDMLWSSHITHSVSVTCDYKVRYKTLQFIKSNNLLYIIVLQFIKNSLWCWHGLIVINNWAV